MEDADVKAVLAAASTEILMTGGMPLATVGGVAVALGGPWVAGKVEEALVILKKRLQNIWKPLSEEEAEEFKAMLLRYVRSAQEGASHQNLRLMASVMAGMIEQNTVYANDFLREAGALSELSSKEIVILGAIWQATEGDGNARDFGRGLRDAKDLLIPAHFQDYRKLIEAGSALVRTGYLMPLSAMDGHMEYRTTAAFERLAELAKLETLDTADV